MQRFVRYQFEGGEYLGNKKPVAQLTGNEIGMLAREPQPSPLGEVPLHDGAGIDVMKMGVPLASKGFKFLAKRLQGRFQHMVIILKPGISSHLAGECLRVRR